MQEIEVRHYCDGCHRRDQTKKPVAPDAAAAITVDDVSATLELCPDCRASLLQPVLELVQPLAATQRAARSAASSAEDTGTRRDLWVWCSQCTPKPVRLPLRSRSQHASQVHDLPQEKIVWLFEGDVSQVWYCSCGLAYPTMTGVRGHARRADHDLDAEQVAQVPPRHT